MLDHTLYMAACSTITLTWLRIYRPMVDTSSMAETIPLRHVAVMDQIPEGEGKEATEEGKVREARQCLEEIAFSRLPDLYNIGMHTPRDRVGYG
jgi:hypothetical protein